MLPSCKWCTLCILLVIILVLLRCVFIKQIFTNRTLLIILFGLLRGSQAESHPIRRVGEVESCVGALTTSSHKALSESSFSQLCTPDSLPGIAGSPLGPVRGKGGCCKMVGNTILRLGWGWHSLLGPQLEASTAICFDLALSYARTLPLQESCWSTEIC